MSMMDGDVSEELLDWEKVASSASFRLECNQSAE